MSSFQQQIPDYLFEWGQTMLNSTLLKSTQFGNRHVVSLLIKFGANNYKECIDSSRQNNHITAFLKICQAILDEEEDVIDILLARNDEAVENYDKFSELMIFRIILAPLLQNGKINISTAINVAMTSGKLSMAGRILQHVSHHPSSGIVDWHDLELSYIDPHWLQGHGVNSFTYVGLSSNLLECVPEQILRFNNLQKIQMHHNRITSIPHELFLLPRIKDIDLSFNLISALPSSIHSNVANSLQSLNLSNNNLTQLPSYFKHSHLRSLDISSNLFSSVPDCLTVMAHLTTLNISSNIGIEIIPYELGNLRHLTFIGMHRLPYIKNMPTASKSSPLEFLKSRARTIQTITHYDVMVVSASNTSPHIVDAVYSAIDRQSKRKHYSCLQFDDDTQFQIFQQFMSLPSSIYVILYDIGNPSSLYSVLSHLFLYSSSPTVIVAACSTDPFINDDHFKMVEHQIKHSNWKQYRERVTIATISTDQESLIGRSNSIHSLIEVIDRKGSFRRTTAIVPNSYSVLSEYTKGEATRLIKENKAPIISSWDMWELVRSSPHHDLAGHKELSLVTSFLQSISSILLLPANNSNEKDYYVLNRQWFVRALSGLLRSHQNMRIANGLYPVRNLCDLLHPYFSTDIPYAVYTVASLLSLAIPVTSHNVLIKSMLQSANNDPIASDLSSQYQTQRLYKFESLPISLWPRLLSHLLINMNGMINGLTQDKTGEQLLESFHNNAVNWNYWASGIIVWINATSLVYSIESVNNFSLIISVSNTPLGMRAMNLLSFTINSLIMNWYPQLWDTVSINGICSVCYLNDESLSLFPVNDCFNSLTSSRIISCPKDHEFSPVAMIPDVCDEDFVMIPMIKINVNINDMSSCLTRPPLETVFKGEYGSVPIAVKPYPPPNERGTNNPFLSFWHELTTLQYATHTDQCPYIIDPLLATTDPLSLVFSFAMFCSMEDVILEHTISVSPFLRMRIVYQLASALKTLHSLKIIHRNVCLENIIVYSLSLDEQVNIKLGGFSRSCLEMSQGLAVGEHGRFPAPEMSKYLYEYDQRADVFSFAFTSYEILTRKKLKCRKGVRFQTVTGSSDRPNLKPLNGLCPYFTPLLDRCWNNDPHKRPYFIEILHQFTKPMPVLTREGYCINETHEYNASAVRYSRESNGTFSCDLYICSSVLSMKDSTVLTHLSIPGFKTLNNTSLPTQCIVCMACTREYLWVSFQHNFIRVYSANSLEFIKELAFDAHVLVMAVSPDCVYLGKEDGEIQVFNLSQPSPLHGAYRTRVISYQQPIKSLQVLDDCLICCTKNSFYRVHPNTLHVLQEFPLVSETGVKSAVVALDRMNNNEYLWVCFRRLQELVVFNGVKGKAIYGVNCSQVIGKDRAEVWITCIQGILDTVWVGLNTGHILTFSAYSPTPLLLTYFKPHRENIRQLVLLQPSYWNPDVHSKFYDDESVSTDSDFGAVPFSPISGDYGSVPSNPSIPAHVIPEVCSVLSCGQGVYKPIPKISEDGILLHDTNPVNGLCVLKMDGPDASGCIKLECQAQRQSRPYMANYNEALYTNVSRATSFNESHRLLPPTPLINNGATPNEFSSDAYESMTFSPKHDPELADFICITPSDVPSHLSDDTPVPSRTQSFVNHSPIVQPVSPGVQPLSPGVQPVSPSVQPKSPGVLPGSTSDPPVSPSVPLLPPPLSPSVHQPSDADHNDGLPLTDSEDEGEGYVHMKSASVSQPSKAYNKPKPLHKSLHNRSSLPPAIFQPISMLERYVLFLIY